MTLITSRAYVSPVIHGYTLCEVTTGGETVIKPISKFPGFYAYEEGNIYSDRIGYLRKLPKRMHRGYYRVNVRDGSCPAKVFVMNVHTLVLNAFVGERPEGMVCRHLNGNALDNRLSNLCWGTPKENTQDAIRHGTAPFLRHGENALAAKLKLSDVKAIKKMYSQGMTQQEIAKLYSISQHHVSDIVNGKTWCRDLCPQGR